MKSILNMCMFLCFFAHKNIIFVLPAKQKQDIYCFSGVCVVGSGVNFCRVFAFRSFFSETIRARALKLGLCIHLEELRSILRSILSLDLLFTVH